jgi:hypothetical protein
MSGPYLYDDDPAPLHTGTPRNRNWSILILLGLTVLLAIGTVVGMVVFRGSPADEAEERARVFVAALAADDVETASALLCEEDRSEGTAEEVLDAYTSLAGGTVGQATEEEVDGDLVQVVPVQASDGTTAELVLVPQGGPRVCGLR